MFGIPTMKTAKLFNIFYGTPAKVIADCCMVSLNTAYQWKRGDRQPGPQSLRLFLLHRHGRVLGNDWEGWSSQGDALSDPDGNRTTIRQLLVYPYVYQLCAELVRDDPKRREMFDRLMRMAS